MTKVLCIYHANCVDGFGAAWAVRHALGPSTTFHAAAHGSPPPDVAGMDVVIVDFSYKRDVLLDMAQSARTLLVLDHHKTAMKDLKDFPAPIYSHGWNSHVVEASGGVASEVGPGIPRVKFDTNRSGAKLAWDFFHAGSTTPPLIQHIQDRDLWKFDLARTREIIANLFSYPYDFGVWDTLMKTPMHQLARGGTAIERKHMKDVGELVAETKRTMCLGGFTVPVANVPYTMASDAGHLMLSMDDEAPFAATYYDTATHRVFSLRSDDTREDASAVAVGYGGGGHRNACGFKAVIGWEGDDVTLPRLEGAFEAGWDAHQECINTGTSDIPFARWREEYMDKVLAEGDEG